MPFPIAPLLAALVGAAASGCSSPFPALRVRGVNLAIVTFAAAVAMEEFMFKNPAIGGLNGAPVDRPGCSASFGPNDAAGVAIGDGGSQPVVRVFCLVVAAVLAATSSPTSAARRPGASCLAVRANERAAAAAGINVAGTKLLGVRHCGVRRRPRRRAVRLPVRLGHRRIASAASQSLTFLAFAYLGGISSVAGRGRRRLAGGRRHRFTILDRWFDVDPGEFTLLLGGLGLILTAILNPEGIAGGFARLASEASRARRRPRPGPTT